MRKDVEREMVLFITDVASVWGTGKSSLTEVGRRSVETAEETEISTVGAGTGGAWWPR